MKNILMVYPKFPDTTYWSFKYSLPFINKKSSMPPLGLITVAGMLPSKYDVKLVDMNVEELKDEDIEWADSVFTSSMIVQKDNLEKLIDRLSNYDKTIVAGGPHPTQYFNKIKGVDHFIIGEAESGVLESFLNDLENGKAKKAYANIVLRKKKSERLLDEREFNDLKNHFWEDSDIKIVDSRPDLVNSPIPRFDLLNINDYGSMALQYSRGCPHSCEFCNEGTLFGHKMRSKSSDKLVKELEQIYNLGYRGSVFFVDDNLIGNKRQIKKDLVHVRNFQEDKHYPFTLYTEATINLAKDEELMRLMRDSGFNMVFVGIETLDEKVLGSMNKHHNTKTNMLNDIKTIQNYGMEVTGGFIVGNDNEPDDVCDKIFDFCQEAGIPTAMVGLLTALKGSPLHERLRLENRLLKESEGDNTHSFELNFDTIGDKDKIVSSYKNLLSKLYDSSGKNYYERCSRLLENLGYNPKASRRVGGDEIGAFRKSLLKQSFNLNYLNYVGHSLVRHRGRFPEAIRLAILGYHFRKITKSSLKADFLKNKLLGMYSAWSESKGESFQNIQVESSKYLKGMNKKIRRLPEDYRPKLIEVYDKIVNSVKRVSKEKYFRNIYK